MPTPAEVEQEIVDLLASWIGRSLPNYPQRTQVVRCCYRKKSRGLYHLTANDFLILQDVSAKVKYHRNKKIQNAEY